MRECHGHHAVHALWHRDSLPTADNELKPLHQGELDGLCGLYALINAARWVDPTLHLQACKAMFQESLELLHANGHLPGVLYKGIPAKAMLCLHGRVIRRYRPGLKLKRPFFGHTPMSDEEFWAAMASLLETPRSALVAGIFSGQWSHWTVINRITEGQVHLFDSRDLVWIRRRSCTCSRGRPGTFFIDPTEVFLIEAERGAKRVETVDSGGMRKICTQKCVKSSKTKPQKARSP